MTEWGKRGPVSPGSNYLSIATHEYEDIDVWLIVALKEDNSLVYWLVYHGEAGRICTEEKPVTSEKFAGTFSLEIIHSDKDGHLHLLLDGKEVAHYVIKPAVLLEDLPEPAEPPIKKLDPKLSVPALQKKYGRPIFINPFFIPSGLIEKNKYLPQDIVLEELLDVIAENAWGNADRMFAFGGWELETLKMIIYPWKRNANSKFMLAAKNPDYLEQAKRRIGDRADRNFFSTITLTDNCSTHENRPGFWNAHPWNGKNNVNGTSEWKGSIYHFYEDDKQELPGIPESAQWIEEFIRWIARELDKEFRPLIGWEICNEAHAGNGYHDLIRGWLKEEGVKEDWRVMASIDGPYKSFYKKQMGLYLKYSIHGIQTYTEYVEATKLVNHGIPFVASEDGLKPIDPGQYKDFVFRMLKDGSLGFESNSRPYFSGRDIRKWLNDPKTFPRMKAIGEGWKKWLNV